MSFVGRWTWSYMKYLNFVSVLYSLADKWVWFLSVWPRRRKFASSENPGLKIRLYEGFLHEGEDAVGKTSRVASGKHLLFATRTAVASAKPSPWSSDVPLARLCGHLRPGPPHPPGLHSGSKNISALNKRQNMRERATTVLRSQMNLSDCQGRNLGSPPFSPSLSLCVEMDLPWVICERLKLISLAPCKPLLGNNIGFSSELLGGRHMAGAAFSPLFWEPCTALHAQLPRTNL